MQSNRCNPGRNLIITIACRGLDFAQRSQSFSAVARRSHCTRAAELCPIAALSGAMGRGVRGAQVAGFQASFLEASYWQQNITFVTRAPLYKERRDLQREGRRILNTHSHRRDRERNDLPPLAYSSRSTFVALRYISIYSQTGRSRDLTSSRGP